MIEPDLAAIRDAMLQERRESVHAQLAYEFECQLKARLVKTEAAVSSPVSGLEHFFDVVVQELADLRVEVAGLRLEVEAYKQQLQSSRPASAGANKIRISSRLRPEPTRFDLDFSRPLPVAGWYELEYMPDGTPFRWLGPEPRSTFDIVISRRMPLAVTVKVISALQPDMIENIRLLADGEPLPLKRRPLADGQWEMIALVPAAADTAPVPHLALTLETNQCLAPRDVNPASGDDRPISLAVNHISLAQNDGKELPEDSPQPLPAIAAAAPPSAPAAAPQAEAALAAPGGRRGRRNNRRQRAALE